MTIMNIILNMTNITMTFLTCYMVYGIKPNSKPANL